MYRWEGGPALVQTVDFFTPIVDDPYTYGQIAAANALSDVYAMGGRPLTALAIAAFPQRDVSPDVIRDVFRGGYNKLEEAGVALLGGHTIQDPEVKFGYAVTGAVDPERILSNTGARPGDVLYLTKAIGTGVIGTAIKFGRASEAAVVAAVDSMCALNRAAADAIASLPAGAAHACTDITGFGLIGHATAMAIASSVTMTFDADRVPLLPAVRELVPRNRSGGLSTNKQHFAAGAQISGSIDPDLVELLYDPQTSGGLLISVDPNHEAEALSAFSRGGITAWQVGRVSEPSAARIVIT